VGVACDVHTPEVEPEGGDRSQRERTRWERRIDWPADSSQGDIRAPLAGQGTALDRADDAAPRNDNAEVASGGFDESLHEQAVATKPAPARNVVEPCLAARPHRDSGAYGDDVDLPVGEVGKVGRMGEDVVCSTRDFGAVGDRGHP
jgi:hypothetical protein